ncbi:MAG: type II CRISPR-associated endonuclease Cas1 [Bacteroidetes bacterium]|nr:type II CRISPR-associated endonuclease Cas1 [Bacteroidota bacterium]MBU1580011.1 type II CRISPR-associated endonuclease Cas1 [Bacteroidota bacterium]MBU2466765.1 type II CRISPR-associated endonuclease Cas1 [Bacteroidota bacterium]MBU2557201.1 type II CRISPR-associated endonuclease Cas1 [Bacteroidota bacterium]
MLKRTLFISNPYHLSLKNRQLVVSEKAEMPVKTIPVEDVGFVVLDNPQISFTMKLVEELNDNNVAVVFCNSKHMPSSLLLPLDANHIQNEMFRAQISASEPLKKNLWKQTVEAKINNQARLLEKLGIKGNQLRTIAKSVKSDDSDNREGFAARIYWNRLFGKDFIRDRYGNPPNMYLNYGYILLRSAVARAIAGSGLLATLGIHHRNRYNAFCLADDIMEPYRPWVDEIVLKIKKEWPNQLMLEKEQKAELLQLMSADVRIGANRRPLMIALSQTTASLARCFTGEARKISYPEFE